MVKLMLFAFFALSAIINGILYAKCKKRTLDEFYKSSMLRLLALSGISDLIYAISFTTMNLRLYSLLTYTSHMLNLALVFCILSFIIKYTGIKRHKYLYNIVLGIIVLNSILVFSNLITPWAVTYDFETHLGEDFIIINPINGRYWRNILPIILAMAGAIVTLRLSLKEKGLYKIRYLNLAVALVITTILNIVLPLFVFTPVNLLVIVNSFLVFEIYYFIIIYLPKVLAMKIEASLAQNSYDAYIVFDVVGNLIFNNEASLDIFTKEELQAGYESFSNLVNNIPCDKKVYGYTKGKGKDKLYYKIYHNAFKTSVGTNEAYYYVIHDVTKELRVIEEKNYSITHDALTGIYNRERFLTEAEKFIKDLDHNDIYLIATNFVNFRLYNELYSQEEGDKILVEVAKFLVDFDTEEHPICYARMGSDHFSILIKISDYEKYDFGNYFIRHFRNYEERHTFLKLGICPLADHSIYGSFERAIQTIHYYHSSLRERIDFYSTDIKYKFVRENLITSAFDKALEEGQFKVYYQPQMNSFDYTMFGAEALVRWEHPELGLISPGEFVPIFERKGVITRLDLYVWEDVLKTIREFNDKGYTGLSVSINISRLDFFHLDVYKVIKGLCDKYGVAYHTVKLEITESVFTSEKNMIIEVLKKLQGDGFLIEMDDFGSGYSSLNSLKEIPIDIVKLDMEFLRNETSDKSLLILDSIISMAHRLKMPVIAEGVETKEHVEMLLSMDCNLLQGYYYSKPIDKVSFEKYVAKSRIKPCLDKYLKDDYTLTAFSKDADSLFGLYPDPILIFSPLYDENEEIVDSVVLYQNQMFDYEGEMGLGNIVGRKLTDFDDGIAGTKLQTLRYIISSKERLEFEEYELGDKIYNISLYAIKNSDNIVCTFKRVVS